MPSLPPPRRGTRFARTYLAWLCPLVVAVAAGACSDSDHGQGAADASAPGMPDASVSQQRLASGPGAAAVAAAEGPARAAVRALARGFARVPDEAPLPGHDDPSSSLAVPMLGKSLATGFALRDGALAPNFPALAAGA